MSNIVLPKIDQSIIERKKNIFNKLKKLTARENFLSHEAEIKPYETDALAAYKQKPMGVVLPENTDEVSNILKFCYKENIKVDKSSLFKAITTVIIADVTMSLDNVLGVAGAAKDHYVLLIFGLALSIALMATAANLISKWIKEYRWIAWIGILAILVVAIDLIYTDLKILI